MSDREKSEVCAECPIRLWFARVFDTYFDWRDCIMVCDKFDGRTNKGEIKE